LHGFNPEFIVGKIVDVIITDGNRICLFPAGRNNEQQE
jgi:hypothetical protein